MQRYFIPPEQFGENTVIILGDDAHHLLKVLRVHEGHQVICCDGISREAIVEITELTKGLITAVIVERLEINNEPKTKVWIAQSLPKADKMETVIQKCTEIGAVRFIPFISDRTIVQYDHKKEAKRLERWEKIAKEAAEQSHRNRIPTVDSLTTWKSLLELLPELQLALICYEKETAMTFKAMLQKHSPLENILIIIGPEGGFTSKEIKEAETAGCQSVSLGKRILRTETAAMAALTCILYETGEMGG
jgi:16S rRNA (uracil1498-N3)-methyltransferase